MSQRSRSLLDWIKIYALPITVCMLGLIISGSVFFLLKQARDRQIRRNFHAFATSQVENLQGKIDSYTSILQLISDFYRSTGDINRLKFQSLTKGILDRHDELSSVQWLPAVNRENTDKYITSLQEEGFENTSISNFSFGKGNFEDTRVERFFPVTYVEPTLPGQKKAFLGIDYLSYSIRPEVLEQSAKENKIATLLSVPSVQDISNGSDGTTQDHVLVMLEPVYGGDHMFIEDRWENLSGYLALQIAHEDLINNVFTPDESKDMQLYIHDNFKLGNENRFIYADGEYSSFKNPDSVKNWWTYEREVPIGDKNLFVLMSPSQQYLSDRQNSYPWVVLFFGIAITALLGRGSYQLSGEYLSREKQFYSIFDNAPYAIATLDQDNSIQLWNNSAHQMFGYSSDEAEGKSILELIRFTNGQQAPETVETLLNQEEESDDLVFREAKAIRKDGKDFPINLGISRWELKGFQFFTVMAEDITERKKYERKIKRMARRDNLTGLFNRGTFMEKIQEEFERVDRYDQDLSIIMLDVDHFKEINDTHGHLIGDKVLKGLANTLEDNTRGTDFPGRYGGEEFCIALPETSLEKAEKLAERIREKIEDTNYAENGLGTTASFGVADYREDIEGIDELLNRADEALYHSKENGRNQVTSWEKDGIDV